MVRLTAEYIARCNSHTKRKRDEPTNHYLKRITHLYMAERNIETIDNLSQCRNLTVLYLYDNKLNKTMNLGTAQNLTHLYLQNNNISKIEGLKHLQRLTKLYLGYNDLSVIEGLESLELLKELHVEYQRLPSGEKLLFDPRTINGLGNCLQCLNISGNHIDSLKELEPLSDLVHLQACDNDVVIIENLRIPLMSWHRLSKLDLTGNPICHKSKYRDKMIVMSQSIELLDGREISKLERQFLISWKASREARRRSRLESQKNGFHDDIIDLPPLHHAAIPTPPPHYMMGGLPGGRKRFEAILARSRSLPNSAAVKQLTRKRRPPYTTPAPPINSILLEHETIPEVDEKREVGMMGRKSISDLTDKKRLERQMTPHPHTRRHITSNSSSHKPLHPSPVHPISGSILDVMGSGDVYDDEKLTRGKIEGQSLLKENYPFLRNSNKSLKSVLNGGAPPVTINDEGAQNLEGEVVMSEARKGSSNLSKTLPNKEENTQLVVANGHTHKNGVINGATNGK